MFHHGHIIQVILILKMDLINKETGKDFSILQYFF